MLVSKINRNLIGSLALVSKKPAIYQVKCQGRFLLPFDVLWIFSMANLSRGCPVTHTTRLVPSRYLCVFVVREDWGLG